MQVRSILFGKTIVIHNALEYGDQRAGGIASVTTNLVAALKDHPEIETRFVLPRIMPKLADSFERQPVADNALPSVEDGQWQTAQSGKSLFYLLQSQKWFPFNPNLKNDQNIYGEAGVYGTGTNSQEPSGKFQFFGDAAAKLIAQIANENPEDQIVVQYHDHHGYSDLPLPPNVKRLVTIHNAGYTGTPRLLNGAVVPPFIAALRHADQVSTVSPNYMKELVQPDYPLIDPRLGEALQALNHRGRVTGILNGIDPTELDPDTSQKIRFNYSVKAWQSGKSQNKAKLQSDFGLPLKKDAFVVGMVSRIAGQKGFNELIKILPQMLQSNPNLQLVLLGNGEEHLEKALEPILKQFPKQIKLNKKFDLEIAQHIYAGSDAFLIPSQYEPCGLTQMEAMRYGSVPIVSHVGGLVDTVFDSQTPPQGKNANGFAFKLDEKGQNIQAAVERAQKVWRDQPKVWEKLVQEGMTTDFSWKRSSQAYAKLYQQIAAYTS